MSSPSPATLEMARGLLAASRKLPVAGVHRAGVATEALRVPLLRLVGVDGWTSLLRRALALASEDLPSLRNVVVGKDGCFEESSNTTSPVPGRANEEAALVVATHLLGLLIAFIGERLTLQVVRQAWPNFPVEDHEPTSEADG